MPVSTICKCSLCSRQFSDWDVGRVIWGIKEVGRGIAFDKPGETEKHLCVLCIGQIQATKMNHWVLENGIGIPL